MKTKDLTNISLFAGIIIICTFISVPFTVPFTMQTFGIYCALNILGGKKGTIAIATYILLGVVGIPVFSGGNSGISAILGPTGGYIVGFLATGVVFVIITEVFGDKFRILAEALGLISCYALGTIWFCYVTSSDVFSALSLCVIPFILPDILKIALSHLIAKRVLKTKYIA